MRPIRADGREEKPVHPALTGKPKGTTMAKPTSRGALALFRNLQTSRKILAGFAVHRGAAHRGRDAGHLPVGQRPDPARAARCRQPAGHHLPRRRWRRTRHGAARRCWRSRWPTTRRTSTPRRPPSPRTTRPSTRRGRKYTATDMTGREKLRERLRRRACPKYREARDEQAAAAAPTPARSTNSRTSGTATLVPLSTSSPPTPAGLMTARERQRRPERQGRRGRLHERPEPHHRRDRRCIGAGRGHGHRRSVG